MSEIKETLLLIHLAVAVIQDLYYFKVKNKLCLFFAVSGIIYNALWEGINSLCIYLLGLIVPFAVLFPLYALNMLGAGDIKLFCSVGAWIGFSKVLQSIAYSFIFGSIIALIIMLIRGNFLSRLKTIYSYLTSCFITMSLMPYEDAKQDSGGRMHFTIPIAISTIVISLL